MLVVPGGVRSNIAKNNMQRLDMSRFKVGVLPVEVSGWGWQVITL